MTASACNLAVRHRTGSRGVEIRECAAMTASAGHVLGTVLGVGEWRYERVLRCLPPPATYVLGTVLGVREERYEKVRR